MWRCGPLTLALLLELPPLNFCISHWPYNLKFEVICFTLKYKNLYLEVLLLNYEVHEVHTLQHLHLHFSIVLHLKKTVAELVW